VAADPSPNETRTDPDPDHLSQQIARALSRLRLATLRTLERLQVMAKPGSVRCSKIVAQNGGFPGSLARHTLYLNVLKEVGIWPSLLPFETLSVHKAAFLINEAHVLAVCQCDHPGFGTLTVPDPRPLMAELVSLSLHVKRVQAE